MFLHLLQQASAAKRLSQQRTQAVLMKQKSSSAVGSRALGLGIPQGSREADVVITAASKDQFTDL